MRSLYMPLTAVALSAAVLTGCGGSAEPSPAPAPKVTTPAPAAAPAAAAPAAEAAPAAADAGAVMMAPAATPAPAGADPVQAKLFNTSWLVGDFEVTFIDQAKMTIKGGPLTAIAPNGLEANYSYNAGIIEVTAMGTTKTGTWDGEKLVVDGNEGKRK